MHFAVLLKVVPDLAKLRYDPVRKTVLREGAELFIHPFDQRAIRVALDLRRRGETVTLLSMGPPATETALREGLALGADRAILITDRGLAGSDTLVTSRTLARAVVRVGHDLVLAGSWSTDSETGQVGPEVAGLLGVPVVTGVRRMVRADVGDGLELTADTESGWRRLRAAPPLVVTVDEKIVKIRKPSSEEVAAAVGRPVERVGIAELDLAPDSVGLDGSPTVVVAIVDEAPTRQPVLIVDGSVSECASAAAAAVRAVLRRARPATAAVPPWSGPLLESHEVIVLVSGPDGRLNRSSLSVVAEIRRSVPARWVSAIWLGASPDPDELGRLARAGALRLRHIASNDATVGSRGAVLSLQAWLASRPPPAGLTFVADSFGREVAGQLAARSGLGLTGDAVGVRLDPGGELLWRKPAFGGGIIADIRSRTHPSLATLRASSGETLLADARPGDLDVETAAVQAYPDDFEMVGRGIEVNPAYGDLDRANVVVVAGMGVGGPDRIPTLLALVERWGGAFAATRRVVDAGWAPRQTQVGLTGRSLAPALAVLIGVSGGVNHLVGWKRAQTLLAINADPSAPVLRAVDVAVVGRWEEMFDPLVAALDPVVRSIPPPAG